MHVFHDASNGGTRAAYLYALQLAQALKCQWILFLDHDTGLPACFLEDAGNALGAVRPGISVGAVVPRVFDNDVQISPARITSYGRVWVSRKEAAITQVSCTVTAIASASLVRTEFLAAVLPIPASFSLDYLDHWLFRELQRQAAHIAVSSARVEHSLSVQSMKSMEVQRYLCILAAELAFLRDEPGYSRALHLLWHAGRTVKLALTTRRIALVGVCSRAALNIVRAA
jgi:glycosyltransferase involved in cell wall biosynthesis